MQTPQHARRAMMARNLKSHLYSDLVVALVAAGLIVPLAASAAEWDFEPRITLGQSWTDNVELEPSGEEDSDWITEVTPGFSADIASPRVAANVDYELQLLRYAEDSDDNDVYNQLLATSRFALVPEQFFLDAFGRYDQENVSPEGRITFDNLFLSDNLTDYAAFGARPYHVGKWGEWGESLLRYTYYGVRYVNPDTGVIEPSDTDTNAIDLRLGSPSDARGFSWGTGGSAQRTKFDDVSVDEDDEFRYDRLLVELGMPVGPRTRLLGEVGQESDVEEDISQGGLDSNFWLVGFSWEPSNLQTLEVLGGQRFYGSAWEVHWSRRGTNGLLTFDLTEAPTTSSSVLVDDIDLDPESIRPPEFPAIDSGSLDNRVFIRKLASATASYEFTRSTLFLRLYSDQRDYLDTLGGNEDVIGWALAYDWRFAPRTLLGSVLNWENNDFPEGGSDDYAQITVRLTRELNETLSTQVRLSHFIEDAADDNDDYNASLVSLYLIATF
jgi:hypothetical protein